MPRGVLLETACRVDEPLYVAGQRQQWVYADGATVLRPRTLLRSLDGHDIAHHTHPAALRTCFSDFLGSLPSPQVDDDDELPPSVVEVDGGNASRSVEGDQTWAVEEPGEHGDPVEHHHKIHNTSHEDHRASVLRDAGSHQKESHSHENVSYLRHEKPLLRDRDESEHEHEHEDSSRHHSRENNERNESDEDTSRHHPRENNEQNESDRSEHEVEKEADREQHHPAGGNDSREHARQQEYASDRDGHPSSDRDQDVPPHDHNPPPHPPPLQPAPPRIIVHIEPPPPEPGVQMHVVAGAAIALFAQMYFWGYSFAILFKPHRRAPGDEPTAAAPSPAASPAATSDANR